MNEALVKAVREFPILWKFGHNNYKDSGARENTWKELAKKVSHYTIAAQMVVDLLYTITVKLA